MKTDDRKTLESIQPDLVVSDRRIIGCFYLRASLKNPSNKSKMKLICHSLSDNPIKKGHEFIEDNFYIEIEFNESSLYPDKAWETRGKIESWKKDIPEEHWHVNSDRSLCLGKEKDIKELQKQYPFADAMNILLSDYFYYMSYVRKYGREPWEGYRHELFDFLKLCYEKKFYILGNEIAAKSILKFRLEKVKSDKISSNDYCPFYHRSPCRVRDCKNHRIESIGYNRAVQYLKDNRYIQIW